MSSKFGIVDARLTAQNRAAVADFVRLAGKSTERKLKPAESKRFARLQVQLMRAGVVVPMTKKIITQHARALYHSLPWWHRTGLRVRFYLMRMIAALRP